LATLLCRGCNRTSFQTNTPVGPNAVAYTCARCLMTAPLATTQGTPSERPVSTLSERTLVPGFRDGRAFAMTVSKPGRPKQHVDGADRAKAYRARKKARQIAANDAAMAL